MDKNLRRIYFITFIVIFLVCAPIIVLYSLGYRYDFPKNKLLKTGLLIIESSPRSASVYLNNKYIQKTPARIINLTPGEYQIRVEKDGCFSWQKTLAVFSKTTTFADNIILFKSSGKPQEKILGSILDYQISFDEKKVVYLISNQNKKEVWLYYFDTQEKNKIYETSLENDISDFSWSKDGRKILFKQDNQKQTRELIVDTLDPEHLILLDQISSLTFDKLTWSDSSDILYGLTKNHLFEIDLTNRRATSLGQEIINDFFLNNHQIYLISQDYTLKQKVGEQFKTLEELDRADYKFLESSPQYLVLQNQFTKKIKLVPINANLSPPVFEMEINNLKWSNDGKKLVVWNDFEIWMHDFEKQEQYLINRYSEQVEKASWYENLDYLVYGLTDSINIIELDQRDRRNSYQLIKTSGKIELINYLPIVNQVYFIIQKDENLKDGLYSLSIK